MQNSEVTAGSLDDSGPVGASVVAAEISTVSIFGRKSRATQERHMDENSIRFDSIRICHGRRQEENSPVTAAVGDSVGRHCIW